MFYDKGLKIVELPFSIVERYYIHLPMVTQKAEKVGIENLTTFEKVCYVIDNYGEHDILSLYLQKESLVKAIMEKLEEMKQNTEWWSWADAAKRGEEYVDAKLDEVRREGEYEGKLKGKLEGKLEGEHKGKLESLHILIKSKYNVDDYGWLQDLSQSQLLEAVGLVLTCDTYKDFKQEVSRIKSKK